MRIYSVNAGRPWEEWLQHPELERRGVTFSREICDPKQLTNAALYSGPEVVLALIHGVDESDADEFVKAWNALGSVKDRVWWLFYNGSGYRRGDCGDAQVHFLRFDIGYQHLWSDERRRLIEFALAIAEASPRPADAFNRLYPADNVSLASLLALLCVGRYVEIQSETFKLLADNNDLRHAFDQYRRLTSGESKWTDFQSWRDALREQEYGLLATQIAAALGHVPD